MTAHLWVLPWLSLIAGLATLAVALFHTLRSTEQDQRDSQRPDPPGRASRVLTIVFWLILNACGVVVELAIGRDQGVDYSGARGLLLGSLGGLLLATLAHRAGARPRTNTLIVLGVALTEMAIGRLWLTHGEITGLTACALGTIATVICFGNRGNTASAWTVASGATLAAVLALSMELGFTRADQITEEFWPDIPMLLISTTALGVLAVAPIARAGAGGRKPLRFVAALLPIAAGAVVAWWASVYLVHDTTPLKLLGAGVLAALLLFALIKHPDTITPNSSPSRFGTGTREAGGGEVRAGVGAADGEERGGVGSVDGLALLLIFAACAVAYAYWAGYGIAILLIAGWAVYASVGGVASPRAMGLVGPLAVGAMIVAHRALSLQNDVVGSTTVGDSWNLLAFATGAVLPFAAASGWDGGRGAGFLSILRTIASTIGVVLIVGYLLATDATDGLVIGAALALAASIVQRRLSPSAIVNTLFLAFVVLQGMPEMSQWKEPTRHVKVDVLVAAAILAMILALISRRAPATPAEA